MICEPRHVAVPRLPTWKHEQSCKLELTYLKETAKSHPEPVKYDWFQAQAVNQTSHGRSVTSTLYRLAGSLQRKATPLGSISVKYSAFKNIDYAKGYVKS